MRILIATDAWSPQINGVVHALRSMAQAAAHLGAEIDFLTPLAFRTLPLPSYPEIRLALAGAGAVGARIEAGRYDHIHIATEGPIGLAARRHCLRGPRVFTTSYHTRFPDYVHVRTGIPRDWTYACLRRFHNAGHGVMVSTASLEHELAGRGFARLMRWSRGVDHERFAPHATRRARGSRPVFLSVGRLAIEKNVAAFLALDLPGVKVVVGDGPARGALQARFPDALFLGALTGEALAEVYAGADVFVFPSVTDTFGMVMLEALASGAPVAAFPTPGPLDVIGDSGAGVLHHDLRTACLAALAIPRERARAHALTFTWAASAAQFLDNAERAHGVVASGVRNAAPRLRRSPAVA